MPINRLLVVKNDGTACYSIALILLKSHGMRQAASDSAQVYCAGRGELGNMTLLRLPSVYRPQADTWLLATATWSAGIRPNTRVLDLFTGTGVVAIEAVKLGARAVVAVDASRAAVATARLNARLAKAKILVCHGRASEARGSYDLVLANPPYVPGSPGRVGLKSSTQNWEGGPDGRQHLDPLCKLAPFLLRPGGAMLVVHSDLCGTERTLTFLRARGLKAAVVARKKVPFGPVLRQRAKDLQKAGFIAADQDEEELVVIRADAEL